MENNQQAAQQAAEEVKIENQTQEFNTIEEPSQEQKQPGFVGKAWDKTQEFSGSVCATIKEKPGESLAIAGLGYVGIKFIGWVAGKLCGGKKD
jgi:hypothetical protein